MSAPFQDRLLGLRRVDQPKEKLVNNPPKKRPGGELSTRPLHFIWIADCSGSMAADGKMQQLNFAIRDSLPHMQNVTKENPNAEVLIRVLTFASGAQWHVSQPTPLAEFTWTDLTADGETSMGAAMNMLAEQLKTPPMPDRALPPVLVLISDGRPTDEFDQSLSSLMQEPWAKKAVRLAIAIGEDADYAVLQKFIGHSEIKPLEANSPEALVRYIKWVSTAVLKSASAPSSQAPGSSNSGQNVPIPSAPPPGTITANDVW